MQEPKKIDLTTEEMNIISKEARARKFDIPNREYIYPEESRKELDNFMKCYRFLNILSNNLERDFPEIAKKINEYLKQFEDLFNKLIFFYSTETEFGKYRREIQIRKKINENKDLFYLLINDVYPIGRVIKEYDPDEAVGYS